MPEHEDNTPDDQPSKTDTHADHNKPSQASAFKHPVMADLETTEADVEKRLGKSEMVREAFSLIFALQGMKKFQRAADQLENKPIRIVLAGFIAIAVFIAFCLTAANLALQSASSEHAENAKTHAKSRVESNKAPATPAIPSKLKKPNADESANTANTP